MTNLNNRRNSTYIIATIGAVFVAIILYSQFARNPSGYLALLDQERERKDLQFKNDPDSPIPRADRPNFDALAYFAPDPAYYTKAEFIPSPNPDTLTLVTTTGTDYQVVHAGALRFVLQGLVQELSAFRYLDPEKKDFFIPFSDLTSGNETYGGGRYLDVSPSDPLMIDFNRAYNPYCVYNPDFVCPLPPAENHVLLEIRAGERTTSAAP